MNPQLWSWMLTVVGVSALFLTLRRSPWGWVLGSSAQLLWFAYAIATRQWGFLASCLTYGTVYALNFRRWRADLAARRAPAHTEPEPETAVVAAPTSN